MSGKYENMDYRDLNSLLNLYDDEGNIQFEADRMAAKRYMIDEVNAKYRFFHDLREKVDYLLENNYWDENIVLAYGFDGLKALMKHAYAKKFRFTTYVGAVKFFSSYGLKSNDGQNYLERYEDRVVLTAILLSSGDINLAYGLIDDMMSGAFQPATPTFLNAGKKQRGEYSSCYILSAEDNTESIMRVMTDAAQLSRRGGGIGIIATNLRGAGAAIKGIEGASSGLIPFMKLAEQTVRYFNQLGMRQGAAVVYTHAHHWDVMEFLDTKRENADDAVRLKSLSLGVTIPDITFELAKNNRDMYLFEPSDVAKVYGKPFSDVDVTAEYYNMVDDKRIAKRKVSAREFFMTIAEIQFESGYPYVIFLDTANKRNNLDGIIKGSNLCSEILQPQKPSIFNADGTHDFVGTDIICNLASTNIAKAVDNGPGFPAMVSRAIRGLTAVSEAVDVRSSPSVENGNNEMTAIGLGAMNLHGFLAANSIMYGSEEGIDFTNAYFNALSYHAYVTSMELAQERGRSFVGFENSAYADGSAFKRIIESDKCEVKTARVRELLDEKGFYVPSKYDWMGLAEDIAQFGLLNSHLLAVAPTGSISYINHSTSSIHPVASAIEIRKEGKLGRVYVPQYGLRQDNMQYYRDAYQLGPEVLIDTYAAANFWVDQGLSCTLFFTSEATTRDLNKAYIQAWRAGLRSLYYTRIRSDALEGTEAEGCVSCAV